MDNSSEEWIEEDLTQVYRVDNEQSCRALIKILEESQIDFFKAKASFMQEYQLEEFEKEYKEQFQSQDQRQYKGVRGKQIHHLQRSHEYPREQIMELGHNQAIRGHIFLQVYKEQLEQMKEEYQIRISTNGPRLYIFMREHCELNIICKNRLLDMNHSLQLFFTRQANLVLLFTVSFRLRKKLSELNVNVWFRKEGGFHTCIFFSTDLTVPKMIASIQQFTQFDISIVNLLHKSIGTGEVLSMRSVILTALKEDIAILEHQYEIQIEFTEDNHFIVFHTKHSIFGEEPLHLFKQRLNNLIILSVKSINIRDFDNNIRKFIKGSKFATESMTKKRNETFIAIDLTKIYRRSQVDKETAKQVQEFLKLFIILIESNFQLTVYFNHMSGDLTNLHKHIIDIAQDNNLILTNHAFFDNTEMKAILKLKDYSETVVNKRQKEMLLFLQGLILQPSSKNNTSINFIDQTTLENISSYTEQQASLSKSLANAEEEKYKIPWLKLVYQSPKRRDFGQENRDYLRDRRIRIIEDIFNSQSASKFKVWNLELSTNLKFNESNLLPSPYLLRSVFKDLKIRDTYQLATLQGFQVKEEGAIGFLTSEISMPFIPLFIFQRIN